MKNLVILTGPTAVGKTSLSINLAKAINGEIISADSMQIYKKMDIGTAKVMPEEMDGIKHYLIDVIEPTEDFHVVKFKQMVEAAIDEIYAKGKIPIICGGTGFYIQAILYDIDFTENEIDKNYRKSLEAFAKEMQAKGFSDKQVADFVNWNKTKEGTINKNLLPVAEKLNSQGAFSKANVEACMNPDGSINTKNLEAVEFL